MKEYLALVKLPRLIYIEGMISSIFFGLTLACMLAALAMILVGTVQMTRHDGENSAKRSNKLMRMRLIFSALALAFFFLTMMTR